MTDVTIEGNVFYHCGSALIYFNWDEAANPDHQFRNVSFRDNLVFYSTMSDWVDTGEDVDGFTTGAFTIDGGPNMQDGTVEVRDNVFFAARECLVYIRTYVPEYLPDFEGNIYAQFFRRCVPLQRLRPQLLERQRRRRRPQNTVR